MPRNTQKPQKNIAFMSDGNVSLASGGFTIPNRAEVFLFHEVAPAMLDVMTAVPGVTSEGTVIPAKK